MRRSRGMIGCLVGVAVVVLVLVCGALALLVPNGAPIALLPQAQMQQRAVQWAEDQYGGTPTTLALRATIQGEVEPQNCSTVRWLGQQMSLIAGDREWNHCRDDLPMWETIMQGEFRNSEGNTVRTLQVNFDHEGNVSGWIEGP